MRVVPDRPSRRVGGPVQSRPGDVRVQDARADGERAAAAPEQGQEQDVPGGVRGVHEGARERHRHAVAGVRREEAGFARPVRVRGATRRIRRGVSRQGVGGDRGRARRRRRARGGRVRTQAAVPEVAPGVRDAQEAARGADARGEGQGGGRDEEGAGGGAEAREGVAGGGGARGRGARAHVRKRGGSPGGALRARERRGTAAEAAQARDGARASEDPRSPRVFFFLLARSARATPRRVSCVRPGRLGRLAPRQTRHGRENARVRRSTPRARRVARFPHPPTRAPALRFARSGLLNRL